MAVRVAPRTIPLHVRSLGARLLLPHAGDSLEAAA
jgi:hypothetical protein